MCVIFKQDVLYLFDYIRLLKRALLAFFLPVDLLEQVEKIRWQKIELLESGTHEWRQVDFTSASRIYFSRFHVSLCKTLYTYNPYIIFSRDSKLQTFRFEIELLFVESGGDIFKSFWFKEESKKVVIVP